MNSSGRRASPVAVAFAFGAAVAGCGLVVGSGDYVVGRAVDAGSDDSPGSASPDSSAPDTSGPVSEGGASEAGPTFVCGPGGVLVPGGLPTGDATFQQLVDACVLAVSCDPLFFDVTVSDCITNDYLDTYPTKCLASIKSCDDYYACMGSRIATLAECQAASIDDHDTGSCNGQIATNCYGSGDGIISNCATLGGTCTVYEEADFVDLGNIAAGCKIASCTDSTDGIYCGASQVYTCEATDTAPDFGISRQACPVGSTCQASSAGGECFKTTSSCPTPGTSCTNADLTTCVALPSGNQQYTSHCSAAGLACGTDVSGNSACTAVGCANSGCTESCMGTKSLRACIGGAPYVIDCGALGFNTCDSGMNTINTAYAYCAYQ